MIPLKKIFFLPFCFGEDFVTEGGFFVKRFGLAKVFFSRCSNENSILFPVSINGCGSSYFLLKLFHLNNIPPLLD